MTRQRGRLACRPIQQRQCLGPPCQPPDCSMSKALRAKVAKMEKECELGRQQLPLRGVVRLGW
ncbi:MAG TPA: hypothetical protein VFZ09_38870 [Archangium sp.]|uniref:hypothetical protein n=1 Tax=Archangium sp. TaxID=1872627 RepID=UPI002E37FE34|nr:hypothetical protein [Archangium sp.]HEX5752241.1 hypothetical protein [Archangium sp.]